MLLQWKPVIKAIIFDCFGVLTTDNWKEFCAMLPVDAGVEEARRLNHAWDAAKITYEQFLEGVEKATGHPKQEVSAMLDKGNPKNELLFEYIPELKKRRYKLGILSNVSTTWIRDEFLNESDQKYFDDMIFSFELGATKPDPLLYRTACTNLGVRPSEAVFIDDNPGYCEGAQKFGMKAIYYQNFPKMKQDLEKLLDTNN